MQTQNVNLPIIVTGRHEKVTDSWREYARSKIDGLHLDYPRIIEAKSILDIRQSHAHPYFCEILLYCANHIHIEASTESVSMEGAVDETISKIARRMRKFKTRLLKKYRPRKSDTIKHAHEAVYSATQVEAESEVETEDYTALIPHIVHKENYRIRPLFEDEAIMDLELCERNFVVFRHAESEILSIVFKRKDGDYGLIELEDRPGNV